MDMQKEIARIKKELADLILLHLKENKIETAKAQKLAADFLAVLPVKDQNDLLTKLRDLSNNYIEAREIYLEELTKINMQKREEALTQMRNAIAQGNMEHAIEVAKMSRQNS